MEATQHLEWFEDNIAFFETIVERQLSMSVPACPGWTLADLMNHLSFGLGACYRVAAVAPTDSKPETLFADVDRSSQSAVGPKAISSFSLEMRSCLATFMQIDSEAECWTYAGPGVAGFWFRRAAVESTIHRFDAEEALGYQHTNSSERLDDVIAETLDFALPFAANLVGEPDEGLRLFTWDQQLLGHIGNTDRFVMFTGERLDILKALWGRATSVQQGESNAALANDWFSLLGRAFSGR